eukprot:323484_1
MANATATIIHHNPTTPSMVISINMVNVIQFIIRWFIIFIICWFKFLCIFVHLQTCNDATQVHEHTYLHRYTYIKLHGRKKFMFGIFNVSNGQSTLTCLNIIISLSKFYSGGVAYEINETNYKLIIMILQNTNLLNK